MITRMEGTASASFDAEAESILCKGDQDQYRSLKVGESSGLDFRRSYNRELKKSREAFSEKELKNIAVTTLLVTPAHSLPER